jgi:hypothetical protein
LLHLSLWDFFVVHKEGLYAWDEVAHSNSFLIACNLKGLLTSHHQCNENHLLCIQFWELEVDVVSLDFPSHCYEIDSLIPNWAKIISKMNIENEIFNCSLLTTGFESKDELWLYVKIRRHWWGLSGHFLYLIYIWRKYSRSKFIKQTWSNNHVLPSSIFL